MKNIKIYTSLLLLLILGFSCAVEEEVSPENEITELSSNLQSAKSSATSSRTARNIYHDASGKVTIEISESTWQANDNTEGTTQVSDGYVLIGGGAWAEYGSGYGAMLTASYPNESLTTWIAASKDHLVTSPHTLHVYAIGLKLDGISELTLRNYVKLSKPFQPSSEHHPNNEAFVASGYKLIGGGARANWTGYGSMLEYSYPEGTRWRVKSKDHIKADKSTIDAWAIGIKEYIPNFGYLDILNEAEITAYGGNGSVASAIIPLTDGYVMACPGAKSTYGYGGYGRMITSIVPDVDYARATTKDHSKVDTGHVITYALSIRKRPVSSTSGGGRTGSGSSSGSGSGGVSGPPMLENPGFPR
ncbi:MAG: hypothetical protein WBA74_13685 [Cyclobacteriaceae bacterium]